MNSGILNGGASFEIDVESAEMAQMLYTALLPETKSAPSDRAKTQLVVRGSVLALEITAGDLTALRAASNSFLSWVSSCLRAMESVRGQKS
ncbi:MAG: CTAG/PCC1 family protein [Candidatus Thorarchaeota archaeon]|nr:CTAG/PCC1 family protein [Candidatus Thorarchaeota archaeon]